ncbi:MAG: HDOD domain-containing protein [Acidimicrobiales bacterium]
MALGFRSEKKSKKVDEARLLQETLGNIELPSFPGVILDALDTIRQPDSSASQVATAIQADPGVTVKLLRLVNSAAFSPSRPIENVSQAVAIAGLGTVESMLLAVGANVALPHVDVEGLDQRRFWQSAARRGSIARTFAAELHPSTAGQSFTAGLLQDMAIPLLAVARHDYRPVLTEWHGGGDDLHQLEESEFGWSHDQVAAWLCAEWELPADLRNAIGGHHGRPDYDAPPAVELSAPFREVETGEERELVIVRAHEDFGISPDRSLELIEEAEINANEVAQLFI